MTTQEPTFDDMKNFLKTLAQRSRQVENDD